MAVTDRVHRDRTRHRRRMTTPFTGVTTLRGPRRRDTTTRLRTVDPDGPLAARSQSPHCFPERTGVPPRRAGHHRKTDRNGGHSEVSAGFVRRRRAAGSGGVRPARLRCRSAAPGRVRRRCPVRLRSAADRDSEQLLHRPGSERISRAAPTCAGRTGHSAPRIRAAVATPLPPRCRKSIPGPPGTESPGHRPTIPGRSARAVPVDRRHLLIQAAGQPAQGRADRCGTASRIGLTAHARPFPARPRRGRAVTTGDEPPDTRTPYDG
jgi:hypothetical protein